MGRNQLTRTFDHKTDERLIYSHWEDSGAFKPSRPDRDAYCIPMPPPNITGQLHMGHAVFVTLQDILARFHRMRGRDTLWLPGTDHAGLATEEKVRAELAQRGIAEPSADQIVAEAQAWRTQCGDRITTQIRRLGASCDWSRERFTLDDRYTHAVLTALKRCHEAGMLYRQDGQWWLDMRSLAATILDNLPRIIPEHETKTLVNFLANIEPWCISRQIAWGHRMPIWTTPDGRFTVAATPEEAEALLGAGATQETDVLDTWFSSALWPFATLGWPEDTEDLRRFYPAAILETGSDILFFWCGRMLMMGWLLTGRLPFGTIYLHGLVRDKRGRKFSKSLGNGVDPLLLIDRYGTDALRFGLAETMSPAEDIRMDERAFDSAKKLANKVWQASRFALMHYDRMGRPAWPMPMLTLADANDPRMEPLDLVILNSLDRLRTTITADLEAHRFREAAFALRHWFKDDLCDVYIEAIKDRLYDRQDPQALATLLHCLDQGLRLLHPFMPFLTERIWGAFHDGDLIAADWP